jgi:L-histidine Nalpha-methyltransferase
MATANVTIHSSQFPESVRRDLLASLRQRRVNHKFHYDSIKQTRKWLALHEAHSPARTDRNCLDTYDLAFAETARIIKSQSVHVIGLGCGGGQKDTRLLQLLKKPGREISYTPSDVSVAMTLVAREAALKVVPEKSCFPFVCDLATAADLSGLLATRHPSLVTFFGMIPNFEPRMILPKLASLVRPKDFLLFSANLAPGKNYAAGVKKVLPQYDNGPTRAWLMAFLLDLGVEQRDGRLKFTIETGDHGLKRIVARFHFARVCRIEIEDQTFDFAAGESIQLFFSYRYTSQRVRKILTSHGLEVLGQWITRSEEEGVFLCRRK